MVDTLVQWFVREWPGHEFNFVLLGLIFLAVIPTFVEMFVDSVGWVADRFPKLFRWLIASGSAWLLHSLGAPAYVIVLVFAAALAWWALYREVLQAREDVENNRKVLSTLVVRSLYSVHRLSLLSPDERALHESDKDTQADPFLAARVLERFVELADEQGVVEARRFLIDMDLAQIEAWNKGPREMTLRLISELRAERERSYAARFGPDGDPGRKSTTHNADGSPAADGPQAM